MINTRCPICDRPMQGDGSANWPQSPFCSKRCRTIDLGRWLGGTYAIPAAEGETPTEDTDPESP
jgi:endogenous inhibitor of DNA gyrase (YacG/DUF329 family)